MNAIAAHFSPPPSVTMLLEIPKKKFNYIKSDKRPPGDLITFKLSCSLRLDDNLNDRVINNNK